ncbi:MMPL family transporter [Microbispora sp. GKU 823]|uniref:MMPL family transporter n=1 Tax=Microbispora sp. GKU 823 TaxID=1652100 RepID=UPI0009A276D2|nr:MMPL family transporter [Microbispora sp. GKU 823]
MKATSPAEVLMDYEVFLLARIKEEWDRTGDAVASVPAGIARSAPLVTAAAAILAASFAAYATGRVVFLQQLGVGMALTVAVDATLIRGVLVPALMRLAGPANWWAPAPLRACAGGCPSLNMRRNCSYSETCGMVSAWHKKRPCIPTAFTSPSCAPTAGVRPPTRRRTCWAR